MRVTHRDLEVVTATDPADVPVLAEVIAEAFFDLAPSRWLVPVGADRSRIFPRWFALYVEETMAAGIVYTNPNRNAVALWVPAPAEPDAVHYARLAELTGPLFPRLVAFEHALARNHPQRPHYWLPIIAVAPAVQDRGIGTALMQHRHALMDESNEAGYLEAASLASRDFYLRLGYQDYHEPIVLPESGPPMFPMWRDPQAVTAFDAA
jgi:GNAT superfamily N-acetyltransferase